MDLLFSPFVSHRHEFHQQKAFKKLKNSINIFFLFSFLARTTVCHSSLSLYYFIFLFLAAFIFIFEYSREKQKKTFGRNGGMRAYFF